MQTLTFCGPGVRVSLGSEEDGLIGVLDGREGRSVSEEDAVATVEDGLPLKRTSCNTLTCV